MSGNLVIFGVSITCIIVGTLLLWVRARRVPLVNQFQILHGRFAEIIQSKLGKFGIQVFQAEQELHKATAEWNASPPTGSFPNGDLTSKGKFGNHIFSGAAFIDSIRPGLDMISRWESVDHHVFQAMRHLTHQHIENFSDLMKVVEAKSYAINTPGFLNLLVGHVGESHAQEHLMQTGFSVSMPWAANVAGLDLWINGSGVNVKTVHDVAEAAAGHFAKYPDIAILVPGDGVHMPEGALHFDPSHAFDPSILAGSDHLTLVDDALSHVQVVEQTQHAIDVIGDPGPHLHFPWVTCAISSLREGRLLIKGKTEIGRAFKNVTIDTTLVGGSAMFGAKTGAVMGTVLGPAGTLVGTFIGGFVGGITGRHYANGVKRAPLLKAKQQFEVALLHYKKEEAETTEEVATNWETLRMSVQDELKTGLDQCKKNHIESLEGLEKLIDQPFCMSLETATEYITEFDRTAAAHASLYLAEIDPENEATIFDLIWNPTRWSKLRAVRRDLAIWQKQSQKLLINWKSTSHDLMNLMDIILAIPKTQVFVEAYAEQAIQMRSKGYQGLKSAQTSFNHSTLILRASSVGRLQEGWAGILEKAEKKIEPVLSTLKSARSKFEDEVHKSGIKVA